MILLIFGFPFRFIHLFKPKQRTYTQVEVDLAESMKRLSRLQNYNVRRRRWNLTTSNWMANIGQVYDRLFGWDMHKGTRHVHFGERRWQTQQIEISIDALIEIEISLSTNKKKRRIWMKGKFQVFYFFDKLQTIFLSLQSALYEWCLEKWDLCVIPARERDRLRNDDDYIHDLSENFWFTEIYGFTHHRNRSESDTRTSSLAALSATQ